MILLSAHKDLVYNNGAYSFDGVNYRGLLDNRIGMLLVDSLILEDKCIQKLCSKGEIKTFYGEGEEWGLTDDFPETKKGDIVIVVDVASGKRYDGIDFALENISGFTNKEIKELSENLRWENYKILVSKFNNDPELEDESFKWIEKKIKVISFCIPIKGNWHNEDCAVSVDKLVKCKNGLRRTINYLL